MSTGTVFSMTSPDSEKLWTVGEMCTKTDVTFLIFTWYFVELH